MIQFREVLEEELLQVAKLHNDLAYFIQKETKDDYWDFEILCTTQTYEYLQTFINNPERKIYVAVDDKEVVGFLAGEIVLCHLPISSINKVGYISAAYVMPDYRGMKIMTELEKRITDYFKQCGLMYIEVNFIANNMLAKNTWKGLGYTTFREQARKKI